MPTILIADDHDMVRKGLRAVIESRPSYKVVGEAGDGPETLDLCRKMRPDALVLDFSMPGINGLDVTKELHRTQPRVKVIMLTMHESEELAKEVLRAGAMGYILKSDAASKLMEALEHVLDNKPFFTAKVTEILLNQHLQRDLRKLRDPTFECGVLTKRERQILQLIAEGSSTKEVASKLGIAFKTAETHRTNLMRKTQCRSVGELVRYAVRNGLILP